MFLIRLISVSCLLTFLCFSITNSYSQTSFDEKHIEVSLRMVGHRVLLNAADSSSRVLPIEKNLNQYRIKFGSELMIDPDVLFSTVNEVMEESEIETGYILEVEECGSKEIVYSFKVSKLEQEDIVPCQSRDLPKSCYNLLFTFAEIGPVTDLNSPGETADSKKQPSMLAFLPLFVTAILLVFIFWRRKFKPSKPSNIVKLGKFKFDKKNSMLTLEEQNIELSHKEAELLLVLHENLNDTVERDVILNKVWGSEGDYIGRTLDVFISKLRKKLDADPAIKILNVRGIGYKLVAGY